MLPFTIIALAQERLIAEEEARPWQLLRLLCTCNRARSGDHARRIFASVFAITLINVYCSIR